MGAPLRRESRAFQEQVLHAEHYTHINTGTDNPARIAEFPQSDGDRSIVHWSTQRARKDAKQRTQQIAKLRKKCLQHRLQEAFLSNLSSGRFLRIGGGGRVVLDDVKIAQAFVWMVSKESKPLCAHSLRRKSFTPIEGYSKSSRRFG